MKIFYSLFLIPLLSFGACKKTVKEDAPIIEPIVTPTLPDDNAGIGDTLATGIFFDTFRLSLDENKWEKLHQVWGVSSVATYIHGGVIRENAFTRDGKAVLRALGDQYDGPLRGVNGQSKRLGGVIKTKQRFASGRYEVRMKVLQAADMGVLSAAWTFFYKELTAASDPTAYQKALNHGNIANNGKIILNHEIDIEVKGVNLADPLFTNWIGEASAEHVSQKVRTQRFDDNAYHIFRWDWHTGGGGQEAVVNYYIDGQLITSSNTQVPYRASYFNVGNWFAWWAGNDTGSYKVPNFGTREMLVDWVKITPFNEANDDWQL
ncbi:glycoside hydrolase family 16 protein [Pedobacter sp. MC2016-14]|uniref:glycoside hydrolase family 16 protein n=1 Tax=Pedobacter sp. MC2016-14 TaxID=2897327 RepID=UPI001E64E167|nr:glycoside hydrolase family 16 protein [Pedobacter sp. MC2016-14]MCD0490538.1 glycoside hydrolase family 16 protein [Pedobacter sp. MC2016-14]